MADKKTKTAAPKSPSGSRREGGRSKAAAPKAPAP